MHFISEHKHTPTIQTYKPRKGRLQALGRVIWESTTFSVFCYVLIVLAGYFMGEAMFV